MLDSPTDRVAEHVRTYVETNGQSGYLYQAGQRRYSPPAAENREDSGVPRCSTGRTAIDIDLSTLRKPTRLKPAGTSRW
ncbi:hypothetical protein FDG2_0534 [Candidatus Protofrankia californiensis]|uniref:Uncharacterized protein n=1 Tax=Candidatus Protofrankia californiensis TaxID=1839754 RepID=A0A1C3NTT9_9ACTN|nr:hypothetical protein FDG2_0534 [Candidatus Protofrankia californiensis]